MNWRSPIARPLAAAAYAASMLVLIAVMWAALLLPWDTLWLVLLGAWCFAAFILALLATGAAWEGWRGWLGKEAPPYQRIAIAGIQTIAIAAFFGLGILLAVWRIALGG